jgi:hypothetical protein
MNQTDKNQNIYMLNKIENYRCKFDCSLENINSKYSELILEYLSFIVEHKNLNFDKNEYFKFIILRGLNTISHVFYFILLFSKNLDMAFYHSQRAYYFYIEFVEQITDDMHSFLKLSSRDAVLFVYKKTIYDIPVEIQQNPLFSGENQQILNVVSTNIDNTSLVLNLFIESLDSFTKENLTLVSKEFKITSIKINSLKNNNTEVIVSGLNFIMKHFLIHKYSKEMDKKMDLNMQSEIIFAFITKLIKIKVFDESQKEKMIERKFKPITRSMSVSEYVNLLFT